MNEHGIHNSFMIDTFHEIVCDRSLFGSIERYKQRLKHYQSARKAMQSDDTIRAQIDLALLWIELVRGTFKSADTIAWRNYEKLSREGSDLTRLEYRIVYATYQLLIENDYESARNALESSIQILSASSHNYLYAIAARALCSVYIMTGNSEQAEIYAQDAISIFRRHKNKLLLASCLNSYAVLKKNSCYYEEAERLLLQAIAIFREISAPDGEFLCMNNLAVLKLKTGDWDTAARYFTELQALEHTLNIQSDNLLIYKVNHGHLELLRRNFHAAKQILLELSNDDGCIHSMKQKALAHEFLGELYLELEQYDESRHHLAKADAIAQDIAPDSDLMTEILRRSADLYYNIQEFDTARKAVIRCIALCRLNRDRHELGAVLRVLGDIHIAGKQPRKARSAYMLSISILKDIKEPYELMRTCFALCKLPPAILPAAYRSFLIEAQNIAQKLELRYYSVRFMILLGREASKQQSFNAARSYFRKARDLMRAMNPPDQTLVGSALHEAYRELDKYVMTASMNSAQKLRILGAIYEEARFPAKEAGPRIATEVARNVNAESLFLARKRNGGYAIPVKYNISIDKAKRLIKRLDNGNGKRLFGSPTPKISRISSDQKLISISSSSNQHDSLCLVVDGERHLSRKEMEFFIASFEALKRVAEDTLCRDSLSSPGEVHKSAVLHPGDSFREIITVDKNMIRLINLARRASKTDVPVLLQGETGVGKELFARAIHDSSSRRDNHCVAINTGGIPVNFLESELFGHVKGAFTDAKTDKTGLIEDARGGTLFLDEIGDMCEAIQVKLLRLIENGEYRRLGENRLRTANVRIVSATHKDLPRLVEQGKFREDLYYRISTVRFTIPPLRYRQGDIELLIRVLLESSVQKLNLAHKHLQIDEQAKEALTLYDWPGNVRELQNEIMRLVSLMGSEEIVRFGMLSQAIQSYFQNYDQSSRHERKMEQYERMLIIKALEENDWNRFKTAEEIGIPRTTLLAKMRRLNITS